MNRVLDLQTLELKDDQDSQVQGLSSCSFVACGGCETRAYSNKEGESLIAI